MIDTNELNHRLRIDFCKTREQIRQELSVYLEELTDTQIDEWTENNSLENMLIDGEVRYFRAAAKNLLRVSPDLRHYLIDAEGVQNAGRQYILSQHIPMVIAHTVDQVRRVKPMFSPLNVTPIYGEYDPMGIFTRKPNEEVLPELAHFTSERQWNFYSRITVQADAVPDGEEVRCWMPMPRTDVLRQIYFDEEENVEEGSHACLYQTKHAQAGKPTIFNNVFSFTSYAECHPISESFDHPPFTMSPDFEEHLCEQAPHILFSDSLKVMLNEIIDDEQRPYYQARLIFEAMRNHYPWTSAREYSTIDNIPNYVIYQRQGDCGQITMLFITLCRMAGIPARWQSGFMLHPGYENYHDWAEIYIEGIGWMPVDASFGVQHWGKIDAERYFYFGGIDAFRLVVNDNWGGALEPAKLHPRSETVDFQRGEVEWSGGNLYFDKWQFDFWVEPILI